MTTRQQQPWTVHVPAEPGALERLLGILRRRAVSVVDLSVERTQPDHFGVGLTVEADPPRLLRLRAELEAQPGFRVTPGETPAEHPADAEDRAPAAIHSDSQTRTTPQSQQGENEMTDHLFERLDGDVDALRGRRIAVIGYGSQGRAHALNLKDSGLDVVVGLHEGSASAARARADGLEVRTVDDAAHWADFVVLLVPDPVAPQVYRERVAPHLEPGDMLMFAHGFNVHYGAIQPPEGVSVALVAPKSPGNRVRREYQAGRGVPALFAVHQDPTGRARELALAYAAALGCTRAGVLETTFAAETETDLFGEQAVLCGGFSALVKAGFETLVEAGYDPRLAYFECLHELKLIVDLAYAKGLSGMRREVSDTAEFGDYVSGTRVVGDASKAAMREVLEEVRSGAFARQWIQEWERGCPDFRRMREDEGQHEIDRVGAGLRRNMAWLAEEADT